jgi:hypothetical protein
MCENRRMPTLLDRHDSALAAVRALGVDAVGLSALTDDQFLQLTRLSGEVSRAASANAALIAGEVHRRSAPALGSAGLAQAAGYRTPQELMRAITGSTKSEAARAIAVGRMATGSDERPWLAPVGSAVAAGRLSASAAQAIANGLAGAAVTVDELGAAAAQLCDEAQSLDPDRLFLRARELRDELDEAGIADREAMLRERRSLTYFSRADGSSRIIWEMDPETAAQVGDIRDRATSPRLGGPRFDSPEATRIIDDPRSTEQLASDVFLHLLRAGADADPSQLLGSGAPAVRVLVAGTALEKRAGHGRIEGQHDPVSIETVERLACGGATIDIRFDSTGQPLDVGREQRLYTRQQRIALAARDGGCRWPGCERPPSWTEAHHINHWARDGGRTDVADGVLLCRHHHLLVHNNHWEIERDGSALRLIPPEKGRDPIAMRDPAVWALLSA